MTDIVIGSCSVKQVPAPSCEFKRTEPPTLCTIDWTTSRPTPRPDSDVTSDLVEKPGRNKNSNNSASVILAAIAAGARPRSMTLARTRSGSIPSTVVAQPDLQHAGHVSSFEPDRGLRVLAGCPPLVRRFHTVIEGIANQVIQRGFQLLQDVAIDAGLLAHNLESHLNAQLPCRVAHQPRETARRRRSGAAAGWR